jgi:amino acid transporter
LHNVCIQQGRVQLKYAIIDTGYMIQAIRHFIFGTPLASSQIRLVRLAIPLAFVVVSANPLSSVAYAPEEIVHALSDAGEEAFDYALFIALAIVALMLIVVSSYSQVIRAYPGEGGGYVVVKRNLGTSFGLVAAAGLLVDYILTVSVSTTAGVAAIGSAFPDIAQHQTELSILFIILLTVINLRGFRESAQFLSLPVYLFVGSILAMVVVGLFRQFFDGTPVVASQPALTAETKEVGPYLFLLAFSAGCVALTGIESISNTVGIFKSPEARNARITLLVMGLLLAGLFFGVVVLAFFFKIGLLEGQTLVSGVAKAAFGDNVFYYVVQFSTAFILVVAANSSFSAFPRLASTLARDGFVPRALANLGDRLVFSNGVLVLAAFSIILILMFQGDPHHLIPLYSIGVFIGFTLTQSGMVMHWWQTRAGGWVHGFLINGTGAAITGVVLLVLTVTKFSLGAWMVVLAIPLLLFVFTTIRSHYRAVAEALSLDSLDHYISPPLVVRNVVIFPIGAVHRAVLPALEYARAIGTSVEAVHVAVDEEAARVAKFRWERLETGIPLTLIPSPYRAVVRPLVDYIREVARNYPAEHITVVIPEFVPRRLWQQLLHNQTALFLKLTLLFQRRIVVVSVPYHLPK